MYCLVLEQSIVINRAFLQYVAVELEAFGSSSFCNVICVDFAKACEDKMGASATKRMAQLTKRCLRRVPQIRSLDVERTGTQSGEVAHFGQQSLAFRRGCRMSCPYQLGSDGVRWAKLGGSRALEAPSLESQIQNRMPSHNSKDLRYINFA